MREWSFGVLERVGERVRWKSRGVCFSLAVY